MKNSDKNAQPQTAPLVSIICRSINRPQLAEALQSVRVQTYKPIEIILVDSLARGISADLYRDYYRDYGDQIRVVTPEKPLGRAAAANTGLDHARGDYLMFLDDDDWIAPDHIANLLDLLKANRSIKAAYSSVRKVTLAGKPTEEIFDQPYDVVLLRRDNYIPIHAVLFSRILLTTGCRFDESLDIYEDWDFWLQASRQTEMRHLDRITAFYRQGGGSDTAVITNESRYAVGNVIAGARSAVLEKWKSIWTGAELNELIGSMDSSAELSALAEEIKGLHQTMGNLHERLVKADAATRVFANTANTLRRELSSANDATRIVENTANTLRRELSSANDALKQRLTELNALHNSLEELRNSLEELRNSLEQSHSNARQLNRQLDVIYHSLSWRLMGPFRRLKRLLGSNSGRHEN
ncbi:MAG: glycosyltransferase [Pseudohongiellaceae bacterium]